MGIPGLSSLILKGVGNTIFFEGVMANNNEKISGSVDNWLSNNSSRDDSGDIVIFFDNIDTGLVFPELSTFKSKGPLKITLFPVEKDDTPSEEEAFGTGLEGLDETGRNMAFTCFKKVSQYILDAYDSLANPKDKEIFIDYLITNVKLYFDKFESEIAKTVDEPTTDEYESAKT